MNMQEHARYDRLIYEKACGLAIKHEQKTTPMYDNLLAIGVIDKVLLKKVSEAQLSSEYKPELINNKMCDKNVVEAVNNCLRPLYGF